MTNPAAKHIMLIDDEPSILELLSTILKKSGFSVSSFDNGSDFLKAIETTRPDLVLVDIYMPEMDGWSVHNEIRKRPGLESIPVVFLTGLIESDQEADASSRLPAHTCFASKPISPEKLLGLVNRLIP